MKDYYEILEVSRTASQEVIEKAYKVLAKRYHPDLQGTGNKHEAEQKMKIINEAYETLSNEEKRKKYDEELKYEEDKQKAQNAQNIQRQNNQAQSTQNPNMNYNQQGYVQQNGYQQGPLTEEELRAQRIANQKAREAYMEEQERQFRTYYRNLGFKVRERWTWKRFLKLLETIGILIVVILIIWFFPPTHKMLVELYEENDLIKTVVDLIGRIFSGIGTGIVTFFKGIVKK